MKGLLRAFIRRWKLKCFLKRAVMVTIDGITIVTDGESVLEGCKLKELRR